MRDSNIPRACLLILTILFCTAHLLPYTVYGQWFHIRVYAASPTVPAPKPDTVTDSTHAAEILNRCRLTENNEPYLHCILDLKQNIFDENVHQLKYAENTRMTLAVNTLFAGKMDIHVLMQLKINPESYPETMLAVRFYRTRWDQEAGEETFFTVTDTCGGQFVVAVKPFAVIEEMPDRPICKLIRKIVPHYPQEALQKGIQGKVTIHALADMYGRVSDILAVSGPTPLHKSSLLAIQQWVFEPYVLGGVPEKLKVRLHLTYKIDANGNGRVTTGFRFNRKR